MSDAAAPAEPDAAPVPTPERRSLRPSLSVALVIVVLDQLSKHWAVNRLSGDRNIDLFWRLRFHLTFNSGMAFSKGRGLGPIIGVVALIVVVGLLVSLRRDNSPLSTVAVGLVMGGAIGNVADRLFRGDGWFRGSVVDFIDPQWFPIFNVADIAVNVGGALLVLGSLFAGRRMSGATP